MAPIIAPLIENEPKVEQPTQTMSQIMTSFDNAKITKLNPDAGET